MKHMEARQPETNPDINFRIGDGGQIAAGGAQADPGGSWQDIGCQPVDAFVNRPGGVQLYRASVAYETGAREPTVHQQIWLQQGTMVVTLGNVPDTLEEGDCLDMQLNEPITYRNLTNMTAGYAVVIVAPDRNILGR